MKSFAATLLLSTLTLVACEMQPTQVGEGSNLNAALAHSQAGRSEMALPLLVEIYENPTTPTAEKRQALALATALHIDSAEWTQAEIRLQALSDDNSFEAELLKSVLTDNLRGAQAAAEMKQQLGACEKTLTQLREERRNLESTLRKLRELSLE